MNRIHRMNSKNDKLQLPTNDSCRRYSLPTNELIEEYKQKRQSERDKSVNARYRSGSIGASIFNLLRPAENAGTNRSREDIRRSSCINMRNEAMYKSPNLQLPKKVPNHRRRNSAGNSGAALRDDKERRGSSCQLLSSLVDVCSGGGGREKRRGSRGGGGSLGGSQRGSVAAELMESLLIRTGSSCGVKADTEDAASGGGKSTPWFQSLIISQQDREENRRKVSANINLQFFKYSTFIPKKNITNKFQKTNGNIFV